MEALCEHGMYPGECIFHDEKIRVPTHKHYWMPAGIVENGQSALVFGMCNCSEIILRQYDYNGG